MYERIVSRIEGPSIAIKLVRESQLIFSTVETSPDAVSDLRGCISVDEGRQIWDIWHLPGPVDASQTKAKPSRGDIVEEICGLSQFCVLVRISSQYRCARASPRTEL